jgi:hydroxylamine dehydrogenase
VLDPDGKPTSLVATVQAADLARLTQEDWQAERDKMMKTCNQCHSGNFARQQLEAGDDMIKNADHLMAEAIMITPIYTKTKCFRSRRTTLIRFRTC